MMQTETTGVWNSPHHLYTKMLKITNQENQPTPKISKANKYNAILFLGLVILLALATGFLFRNMAQPTKPDIVIRPHYQIQDKKNLSVWVEISSITISRTWNLISGNRPVVTIRGKVDCKDEKVKYGTFVFRPTDDPIWSDIDANKKKTVIIRPKSEIAAKERPTSVILWLSQKNKNISVRQFGLQSHNNPTFHTYAPSTH